MLERDSILVRCVPVPTASLELWSYATMEKSDGGSLGLERKSAFLRMKHKNGVQTMPRREFLGIGAFVSSIALRKPLKAPFALQIPLLQKIYLNFFFFGTRLFATHIVSFVFYCTLVSLSLAFELSAGCTGQTR